MAEDRTYVERNAEELERMRSLVEGMSDDDLRRQANEHWTIAGVLGHIAFWDGRNLALAEKLEHDVPFTESDNEPEDVDWINDATRPLIHAVPPSELARLALQIAQDTDGKMASLPEQRMYPKDPSSPINASRADHRAEHLDDIEAALES